jgi:exo-beta-1,3-glucanase (GH17 family)
MVGDLTCGQHITDLIHGQGRTRTEAEDEVATQFPDECGPCKKPAEAPLPIKPSLTGTITIQGRSLLVNGEAIHIKGVDYNPVGKGKGHPWGLEWTENMEVDSEMMKEAGINVIRPYVTILDRAVLDKYWEKGIYVANTIYGYGCDSVQAAVDAVEYLKDHPSILFWVIGNEWNYNQLYGCMETNAEAEERITEVANRVLEVDRAHPISTIYGEIPPADLVNRMTNIDIWGLNVYRGIGFGDAPNLFQQWEGISQLPMYIGEYGADAWNANANVNAEDQQSQADATTALTQLIVENSVKNGGVCLGGIIYAFNDEWWKDGEGALDTHDNGGNAPGGGPHPDATFNEEYWGLVDIDRNRRLAYEAYRNVISP